MTSGASLATTGSLKFGDNAGQQTVFRGTDAAVKATSIYFNSKVSNAAGTVDYLQQGGTFESTNLTEFFGYCATTARFEKVGAAFSGARLAVGRGSAPSLVAFSDCDVTNGTTDVVMAIGSATMGFLRYDNSRVRNDVTTSWSIGYGNETAAEPATVSFVNGSTVESTTAVFVGHPRKLSANAAFQRSWGRLVGCDSTWKNTGAGRIHVGTTFQASATDGLGSCGELLLTNCTFSSETEVWAGNGANTTGRVVVAGGSFTGAVRLGCTADAVGSLELAPDADGALPTLSGTPVVGAAAGGYGTLTLHNQTLTAMPTGYTRTSGSHTTIDLVDSTLDFATANAVSLGALPTADSGSLSLRMRGGSFSAKNNVLVGSQTHTAVPCEPSELAFENCTADIGTAIFAVGRNANAPGRFVNKGSTVTAKTIAVAYAANAAGSYEDGDGSVTTLSGDFTVGLGAGVGTATVGGTLTAARLFVGFNAASATASLRFVDGANVSLTQANNLLYVGWGDKGHLATVCLEGGVVTAEGIAPYSASSVTEADDGRLYLDGGTFRAKKDSADWISTKLAGVFVGAGGAVFDSNGFAVTVPADLQHDDREGAPALDGGVTKRGAGTVALTGTLSFTGPLAVEAGTLDLSAATCAATPSVSGNGTLKTPAAGLTVTGACALDPSETLTVDGALAFADGASITVDATGLEKGRVYTLLAGAVSGCPSVTVTGAKGWRLTVDADGVRLGPKGALVLIR